MSDRIQMKEKIPIKDDKPEIELPEKKLKIETGNEISRHFSNAKKKKNI